MLGGRVYLCLPIELGKNERKKKNQVKADYDACEADRSKFWKRFTLFLPLSHPIKQKSFPK